MSLFKCAVLDGGVHSLELKWYSDMGQPDDEHASQVHESLKLSLQLSRLSLYRSARFKSSGVLLSSDIVEVNVGDTKSIVFSSELSEHLKKSIAIGSMVLLSYASGSQSEDKSQFEQVSEPPSSQRLITSCR